MPHRPMSYLEWNAARRGSSVAVWDDGQEITFEELLAHVRRMQRQLAARGVREGDVVGVQLPNVWQYVALTSGTTGMPKLASLSAGLKQVTFESFTSRLGIAERDRVLPMTPLTQGIGGMCLYCLRTGAALVMLHEPHWTPEHCLDTATRSRATVMVGVPTNVIRMLNHSFPGAVSLRAVAVAGAPLPPEIAERWETSTGTPISSFYGSMDAGQLAVASPSDPQAARWTTVGRPHDRAEWKIDQGEICMRGDLVQDRYWGEESGPYSPDGWAHMGDLGFVDEAGFLHVVGRVKDIIIRGGSNINPYEVESMLRLHPDVIDACIVGRPHPELGEVPVAFVVARSDITKEIVDRLMQEQGLAHYKWPVTVHRVEELPLSGPGKVNRKELREHALAL